jgi:DNA ligase-1
VSGGQSARVRASASCRFFFVLLAELVQTSQAVAARPARRDKVALLAALLKRAAPGEVDIIIAFLSGAVRQAKVGAGWASLRSARGAPAAAPSLSVPEVDAVIERLARTTGRGSAAAKAAQLKDLFGRATEEEQDFLFRLLIGELRQGALEGIMAEAVASAAALDAQAVRRAAMVAGDLGTVAHAALLEGAAGLARFTIELFRPIQPMLAQTASGVQDALDRLTAAALEWKLDGARIQVHVQDERVQVFTRLLNDVTTAVPEVVELVRRLPLRDAILDGEAIALSADGRPRPFQVTMRRFGRKLDVERLRTELPLVAFFFDLLYVDGTPLLDQAYERRYAELVRRVPETSRPPRIVTADAGHAQTFFDRAIAAGHEGVMAKGLSSPYEAGARGLAWLKIKPAHTLDLVVIAAEWGHGRRKGRLSNLHLAARDSATGGFVMLGKTFKGMTDEMLAWQTERLLHLEVGREGHVVRVAPELVVEVAFNGLQQSPRYPGGLALRFARVVRYREDKRAEQADTIDTIRRLYAG